MASAEIFWSKCGQFTGFPSKESYFTYVKDLYINRIAKMSDEEYNTYVKAQQADTIKRLQSVESYIDERLRTKNKGQ